MAFATSDKKLESITATSQLFDLYGVLLTEKKRQVMELYHEENLSLSEIGEELGISRAAVHDALKSAEKSLREYEEKLGLLVTFKKNEETVAEIESKLDAIQTKDQELEKTVSDIKKLLETIVD